jgi:hypothetical protein
MRISDSFRKLMLQRIIPNAAGDPIQPAIAYFLYPFC